MGWFNGLFDFEPKNEPKKDECWTMKPRKGDPFPSSSKTTVRILDVKNGWVLYYMNNAFPDCRQTIEIFTEVYTKEEQ